jgi:uncharacterized membrane protein
MSAAALWDGLRADGLVEGDYPKHDRLPSPWYVRVMLGVAGWIGALFLLLFVGGAFALVFDNAGAAFVLGAVCCAAAFGLFKAFDGNDFAEQFGLAVSLAGQVLIIFGLGDSMELGDAPFYFATAAVLAVLALVIPNFLHRTLTTSGAALAIALGINQLALPGFSAPLLCLGIAFIWLEPKRWAAGGQIWRAVGYGLVLALLLIETVRLFGIQDWLGSGNRQLGWIDFYGPWIGRGLTAVILVGAAVILALREGSALGRPLIASIIAGTVLFALLSWPAPGLASSVLILLLGFAAGNRLLVALGILSLLGFVSHFYYSLHATLLEKSGLLALTGLCLLAAHFALRRFLPVLPATEAAHA